MIDTIVILSPKLSESVAVKIEELSLQRSCVDFEYNQLLYCFTTKNLKGTFDSSIRVNIKREEFRNFYDISSKKWLTQKHECDPYLEVECSLHKFFLGHNIWGGSDDLEYQVSCLVDFISNQFDVVLPVFDSWTISRLDYARVYNLGSNLDSFFKGFSNVYYPRRQVQKYGSTGLYFPGTSTTLKLYNKHEEFKKNDFRRLKKILSPSQVDELLNFSSGILRIELEVKSRKLKTIYGKNPLVSEFNMSFVSQQFESELVRIFKVGESNMRLYNNSSDVETVLFNSYGKKEGNILLGTWYRLSASGYENVKNTMSKTTFYRHVKKLRDVGVSWNHTDILKIDNNVVEFVFNPFTTNLEIKTDLISKKIAI